MSLPPSVLISVVQAAITSLRYWTVKLVFETGNETCRENSLCAFSSFESCAMAGVHVNAVSAAAAPPRSATSLRDVRFTPIADILGRSRNVG